MTDELTGGEARPFAHGRDLSFFVADAPMTFKRGRRSPLRDAYVGLLLVVIVWAYMQVLATAGSIGLNFGIALRYILLPMVVIALILHIQRRSPAYILEDIGIVMPFFVIGIVSATFNDTPIDGARALVFWILGVLGAAVVAEEIRTPRLLGILFYAFLGFVILSCIAGIAFPSVGHMAGALEGGSNEWRGVVPNKNNFASYSIYALIFGVLVREVGWVRQGVLVFLSLVCIYMSRSGGGAVQTLAVSAYIVLVLLLRALPLSRPLRATLLVIFLGAAVTSAFVLRSFILEMIGKDPTLTGRASIWPAYFHRALEYWPIGAGPGTFTQLSLVTVDVGAGFSELGDIHTPHNMFIAAFGEVGLFGFLAFVLIYIYMAFALPFLRGNRVGLAGGAVAIASIVGGVSETREVFGPGIGMFLMILCASADRRASRESAAAADPLAKREPADERGYPLQPLGLPPLG